MRLRAGLALLCLLAPHAHAEIQPLWEAGAGVAALSFQKYRGSAERSDWFLPIPYFVYRGKVLQIDERRMRGVLFESERAELDLSLGGTIPVRSGDTAARRGMPDLDATLEFGPSLDLGLAGSRQGESKLELRLALRAAIASDFSHTRRAGWLFLPNLAYDVRDFPGTRGWKFGLLAGPVFGDRSYHGYFYGVDPAYVTPERPAYEARAGYGGTQFIAALSKRYSRFWIGGFARWDTLAGAVFADSPLVQTRRAFSAGIAIAWVLGESLTRVDWNN